MIFLVLVPIGVIATVLGMLAQAHLRNPLVYYPAFILSGMAPMLGYYAVEWLAK